MKIAGIYPHFSGTDTNITATMMEPLGIQYILAVANNAGLEVKLFYPKSSNVKNFISEIEEFNPDIAAFSIMTYQTHDAIQINTTLKNINPKIISIAGGPHPTFDPNVFLENGYDFCFRGEGETSFREFLIELRGSQHFENVNGLSFVKEKKNIHNPSVLRIHNLDSIPFAYRDLNLLHNKLKGLVYPTEADQTGFAVVDYSRGCNFNCKYCESPKMWDRKVKYKSARRVRDEISDLKNRFNVNTILFTDLNISSNKTKLVELCDQIRTIDNVYWICQSNTETMDQSSLEQMKKAGCTKIFWGIESTNESTLLKVDKKANLSHTKAILRKASELGIINHGFYMIGFPWETESTIRKDFDKLIDYELHRIRITVATPLIGSRWFKTIASDEINEDYLTHSDTSLLVYKHKYCSQVQLQRLQNSLFKHFYNTSAYIKRINELLYNHPHLREAFAEFFKGLPFKVHIGASITNKKRGHSYHASTKTMINQKNSKFNSIIATAHSA